MQVGLLNVSPAPHLREKTGASTIMWWVVLALLFPAAASVYFFGSPALLLIIVTTLAAVVSEAVFLRLAKRPIVITDGSALVTGLLLALLLPSTLPLGLAIIGSAFAIIIVKGLFGGLGFNIFNPALAARAFLLASWPVAMTTWVRPCLPAGKAFDAITTATPLYIVNELNQSAPGYLDLFLGNRAGSLGETSALAILIGAAILFYKKIIDWPAPTAMLGAVALFTLLLGRDPVFGLLSGGLLIGAFFMATDYVTTPVTAKGRFIFGLGCGALVILIRYFSGFPEGVNYAILFMNILTPLIDKYTLPRVFGAGENG